MSESSRSNTPPAVLHGAQFDQFHIHELDCDALELVAPLIDVCVETASLAASRGDYVSCSSSLAWCRDVRTSFSVDYPVAFDREAEFMLTTAAQRSYDRELDIATRAAASGDYDTALLALERTQQAHFEQELDFPESLRKRFMHALKQVWRGKS